MKRSGLDKISELWNVEIFHLKLSFVLSQTKIETIGFHLAGPSAYNISSGLPVQDLTALSMDLYGNIAKEDFSSVIHVYGNSTGCPHFPCLRNVGLTESVSRNGVFRMNSPIVIARPGSVQSLFFRQTNPISLPLDLFPSLSNTYLEFSSRTQKESYFSFLTTTYSSVDFAFDKIAKRFDSIAIRIGECPSGRRLSGDYCIPW